MTPPPPLRLALVAAQPQTAAHIRTALPPTAHLAVWPLAPAGASVQPERFDAVLVEWDLRLAPEIGALCARLRTPSVPVLAVGAADAACHVAALAVGADAYHPVPLSPALLQAQIAAHGRRHEAPDAASRPAWAVHRRVAVGPLVLDWGPRTATVHGGELPLTPRQFEVLALLARCAGDVVSRDRLLHDVWGLRFDPQTNVVDVHVHHLRRVLERHGLRQPIQTVRGCGYRLRADAAAPATWAAAA